MIEKAWVLLYISEAKNIFVEFNDSIFLSALFSKLKFWLEKSSNGLGKKQAADKRKESL